MLQLRRYAAIAFAALLLAACGGATANPEVVPVDQVAVQLNPEYTPGNEAEKYLQIYVSGQTVKEKDTLQFLPYLKIAPNQVGFDEKNQPLLPGDYPRIPQRDVPRVVEAAVVPENHVGVQKQGDRYLFIEPGYHPIPKAEVSVYPRGTLRYRTIRTDLLADAAACGSYKCEATIDKVQFTGGAVQAAVDVDVIYHYDIGQSRPLYEMGDPGTAALNYIGTPLRSKGRIFPAEITPENVNTPSGRVQVSDYYLSILQASTKGTPIVIESVSLREINVGDDAWRAEQQKLAQELAKERQKAMLLDEQTKNLTKENELQKAKNDFRRAEELADAKNDASALFERLNGVKDVDYRLLWVILHGSDQKPVINSQGEVSSPDAPAEPVK